MRKSYIKFALVSVQLFYIVIFIEICVNRTAWSMVVGAILLLSLFGVKCRHCGTPLWRPEIMGRRVPVRPKIIDQCPVCTHPMA